MSKLLLDLLARQGNEDLEIELDNGDTAVIVPESAEEIAEMAAENVLAETSVELEEHADDVEDLCDKVEELEEQVEELQEVVEGAEALLQPGTQWNPAAFALLYTRGEKLNAKMSDTAVPVMGAESLANATTAELSAREGLEAMGATVKKWGSQAIAFIKKIWDSLIAFIKGLFSKATAVKNKAKAVAARLEKTEKLKETIKLGKWNAFVGVGEGQPKSATGLSTLIGAAGKVVAGSEALLSSPGNAAALAGPVKELSSAAAGLDSVFGPAKKAGGDKAVAAHQWRGLTIAVGYYAGKVETFEDVAKAAKAIRISWKVSGGKTSGEHKVTDGKDALKKYISDANALVDSIASSKVEAQYGAAKRDRIIGLLKAADTKDGEDVGKAVNAVKAAQTALSSVTTSATRLGLAIANGELDYVRACL